MDKKNILESKVSDYEKSTKLNEEIVSELDNAIKSLKAMERGWEEGLELAEAIEKKFNCERVIASNKEFIKRLREDIKVQKQSMKNETEDMNDNYKPLIDKAMELIKGEVGDQERAWIESIIKQYESGKRHLTDYKALAGIVKQIVTQTPTLKKV